MQAVSRGWPLPPQWQDLEPKLREVTRVQLRTLYSEVIQWFATRIEFTRTDTSQEWGTRFVDSNLPHQQALDALMDQLPEGVADTFFDVFGGRWESIGLFDRAGAVTLSFIRACLLYVLVPRHLR